MAWIRSQSPILGGHLLPESTAPIDVSSLFRSSGALKWHFTRIQKILIILLVLTMGYLTFALSVQTVYVVPNNRGGRTHPTHQHHSSVHAGSQTSSKPVELDPNDINPTMRRGVRKALVISSHTGQSTDWIKELEERSPGWETYTYVWENPEDNQILLKGQLGREALAYLTFIVDNYHKLPDYSIFNHGHDRAWHQPMRLVNKIFALNYTALDEEHYISFQCTEAEGCTEDTKYYFDNPKEDDERWGYHIEKFWNDKMRPHIGPMPRIIGRRCCAQFAVDRGAILNRPLIFYERLRDPLVSMNMTGIQQIWGEELPDIRVGTMFEMTWHIIFGKPADYCPSRDFCNQVHFQDKIHCDREIEGYKNSSGWEDIQCTNDLTRR